MSLAFEARRAGALFFLTAAFACGTTAPAPAASDSERASAPAESSPTEASPLPPAPGAPPPPASDAGGDAAAVSTSCAQGGVCAGTASCQANLGDRLRLCTCTGNAWSCNEILPAAPTTCVPGGACAGAGTCAVDDGGEPRFCRCDGAGYRCTSSAPSLAVCTVDAAACLLTRPDPSATEWLGCVSRANGATRGSICTASSGGFGANGLLFAAACPTNPPTQGTTCSGSETCACRRSSGAACVCGCMNLGFGGSLWTCL